MDLMTWKRKPTGSVETIRPLGYIVSPATLPGAYGRTAGRRDESERIAPAPDPVIPSDLLSEQTQLIHNPYNRARKNVYRKVAQVVLSSDLLFKVSLT